MSETHEWIIKKLFHDAARENESNRGSFNDMLNGVRSAGEIGLALVTFSGFCPDSALLQLVDPNFYTDDNGRQRIYLLDNIAPCMVGNCKSHCQKN